MTAPTEQFVDAARPSQEAVTTAITTWADTMQSFASKLTSGQSSLPDLQDVVEQYFDFAAKVLASQREVAQQWATVAQAATEQTQRATRSVTARTANGTEAVVDNAAETARVAAGETARTARAAGDTATS